MRAFAVQIDIAWEDKRANFAKVEQMLAAQSIPPGSLVVLAEMFATGFSMNVARIAEPPRGETFEFLSELARRYQSFVIGGVATRGQGIMGRNESIVCGPDGEELARYLKLQPFTLGGERDQYEAGDRVVVVDCGGVRVAPFICYDLRFPELFRPAAHRGAEVIAVIASWPRPRDAHWQALLRARAIENQAYVIGVNRCGNDPRLTYRGQSAIFDPHGNVVADAGEIESLIAADLDLKSLADYRRKFPVLADMSKEHFQL